VLWANNAVALTLLWINVLERRAHDCKRLILLRNFSALKNMAASLVRLHADFGPVPHIFCGQNCEQGPWPGSKPLIPNGKISLLEIYAEQGFTQLPPCAAAFFLFPTGR
jgi:hypothetical protein